MSRYFVMVPTGNERKTGNVRNGEETLHSSLPRFTPFPPVPILVVTFGVIDLYQYS